jgi:hypothetical protein
MAQPADGTRVAIGSQDALAEAPSLMAVPAEGQVRLCKAARTIENSSCGIRVLPTAPRRRASRW